MGFGDNDQLLEGITSLTDVIGDLSGMLDVSQSSMGDAEAAATSLGKSAQWLEKQWNSFVKNTTRDLLKLTGIVTGSLTSAFSMKAIVKEWGTLSRASTDYLKTSVAVANGVEGLNRVLSDLREETTYYSETAGMQMVSTLASQAYGMEIDEQAAAQLANQLKDLYLTTEAATQAAQKYAAINAILPGLLDDVTNAAINTGEALLLDSAGVGLDQQLEMYTEQLAAINEQLDPELDGMRALVQMWDSFRNMLQDVAVEIGRAMASTDLDEKMGEALKRIAKIALNVAEIFANMVDSGPFKAVVGLIDGVLRSLMRISEFMVDHPTLSSLLTGSALVAGGAMTGNLGMVAGGLGIGGMGVWQGVSDAIDQGKEAEEEAVALFKEMREVSQAELEAQKARTEQLIKQIAFLKFQLQQLNAQLDVLSKMKQEYDILYDIAHTMSMDFGQMEQQTRNRVQNLREQLQVQTELEGINRQTVAAAQERVALAETDVDKQAALALLAQARGKIQENITEKQRLSAEISKTSIGYIQERLALEREIINVNVSIAEAQMNVAENISSGLALTTAQRGAFVTTLEEGLAAEKEALRAAYERANSTVDTERRQRMLLDLQKQSVELLNKEAQLRATIREQVESYYQSYAKYRETAIGVLQSEYDYQAKINAGLTFSTAERVGNIKAQREQLELMIQRYGLYVKFAEQKARETGDAEILRQAQENYNKLLGERTRLIQSELDAFTGYYDALKNALDTQVSLASANLELMEKANLGLGVNIQQRMKVYALEKQALDIRQAELNSIYDQVQGWADSETKQEAMLNLQKQQAELTREQAGLIDKMKISMEDYLDAFSASTAGSTEAFSKLLDPMMDVDRLMQSFLGGVGSLERGMTGANYQFEQMSAKAGNERASFQVGGMQRMDRMAGGGAYVPVEALSIGAAAGTFAAGNMPIGLGNQYWGGQIGGHGWVPGGPGVQGMGSVASVLYPAGVTGASGMPGMQIMQGGIGRQMTQYGTQAIGSALGANRYLPGVSPTAFGGTLMSEARGGMGVGGRGGGGGGGTTLVFNIQGSNREQIIQNINEQLRRVLDVGGSSRGSNVTQTR